MIKDYCIELSNGSVVKIDIKYLDKNNNTAICDMLDIHDNILASNQWLCYNGSNKSISLTEKEIKDLSME